MDSKASFRARALEIGIEAEAVDKLVAAGLSSFSKLAYVCAVNPSSGDDTKFKQALETLLGSEIRAVDMISYRQLWFESYTIAMTELEDRVKKTPLDTPKSLPLAERMVRVEKQKKDLPGLVFDQYLEPAHSLTDKAHAMIEDGVLLYLAPEKCISRHDEIQNQKSEPQVSFDGQGNLKVTKRAADLSCDTSGELKLRQALTRKALACDQAGLCSFKTLEEWHNQMMTATMRQPPSGHKYISMQQVLHADRELWSQMSQESRGALKVAAGADPPLDKLIKKYRESPQILCFMTPLPGSSTPAAPKPQPAAPKNNPAPKRPQVDQPGPHNLSKNKYRCTEGGKTVKDLLNALPQNCVSKTDSGKFICLHFNNGTCRKQKSASCNMGLHICYYKGCNQKRPYIECSH